MTNRDKPRRKTTVDIQINRQNARKKEKESVQYDTKQSFMREGTFKVKAAFLKDVLKYRKCNICD